MKIIILLFFLSITNITYAAYQDNLVAYYPLDNTTKLNSTVNGSQTLTEGSAGITYFADFINLTRGSDSKLITPTTSTSYSYPARTHNWTVSLWFVTYDLLNNGYQCLIRWTGNPSSIPHTPIRNSQSDKICLLEAGGGASLLCTPPVMGEGVWHNFVISYQEYNATHSLWTMYLDNTKNSSFLTTKTDYDGSIYFGAYSSGGFNLEGGLRDIAIWDRKLTDQEVSQVYQTGGPLDLNPQQSSSISTIFPTVSFFSLIFIFISSVLFLFFN